VFASSNLGRPTNWRRTLEAVLRARPIGKISCGPPALLSLNGALLCTAGARRRQSHFFFFFLAEIGRALETKRQQEGEELEVCST